MASVFSVNDGLLFDSVFLWNKTQYFNVVGTTNEKHSQQLIYFFTNKAWFFEASYMELNLVTQKTWHLYPSSLIKDVVDYLFGGIIVCVVYVHGRVYCIHQYSQLMTSYTLRLTFRSIRNPTIYLKYFGSRLVKKKIWTIFIFFTTQVWCFDGGQNTKTKSDLINLKVKTPMSKDKNLTHSSLRCLDCQTTLKTAF